jgi:hypothetical protein
MMGTLILRARAHSGDAIAGFSEMVIQLNSMEFG